MNDLEKKSFYSFLGLYIFTSLFAVFFIAYWYYTAQKNALENETYYKLEHLADMKAGNIIMAHMQNHAVPKINIPSDIKLALINTEGTVVEGSLVVKNIPKKVGYFQQDGYDILISDASHEHLNIRYIVLQSHTLALQLKELQYFIGKVLLIVSLFIIIIAWMLSKLFMKPVRQRIVQIERFINDITHELNTPITSLFMSSNQALKQGECSPKMLKNISISTKQLYDIYRSLAYLNFSHKEEINEVINLQVILDKNIDYYRPLAEVKRIDFKVEGEETLFTIPEVQATLLFGNLIGNAIKYSSQKSSIMISLKDRILSIKDQGIGIEPAKQKEIFEKFKRGTGYSGGFGVGLNIVKSICDEYHIKIELDSEIGKGTEFRLYL